MGAHMFCIRIFRCVFLNLMSFELRICRVHARVLVPLVVDVGSKVSLKKCFMCLFICTQRRKEESLRAGQARQECESEAQRGRQARA